LNIRGLAALRHIRGKNPKMPVFQQEKAIQGTWELKSLRKNTLLAKPAVFYTDWIKIAIRKRCGKIPSQGK